MIQHLAVDREELSDEDRRQEKLALYRLRWLFAALALRELDALRRDCWKPALGKARLRRRAIKVGRRLAEPRRRFIAFEVIQALEGGDDPRHAIRATRSMRSGSSSASRPCARGPSSTTRPASSPFPCSSTA